MWLREPQPPRCLRYSKATELTTKQIKLILKYKSKNDNQYKQNVRRLQTRSKHAAEKYD